MLYDGKTSTSTTPHNPNVNNNLPIVTCSKSAKIIWIILIVLTFGLLYIKNIIAMNRFKEMQIKINESASNIDVQLQKRYDTLTKLVSSVKSHTNFNKDVFTTIAAYRSGMSLNEKSEALSKINSALTMAFENYPNLGADESIRTLNTESIMIEKEIAATRRLYNSLVSQFNSEIYQWPNNVILNGKNYSGIPLFVADETKRQDVKIEF